jgi:formyl-CoA transferase
VGALEGVRVVEAGLLVQGPQAAAAMADWGADVVKVELPGFGDQARWIVTPEGNGRPPYFIAANRGKRSVTLDLRLPGGRKAFLRLCRRADVVITNFKPGTMDAWGLSYEECAAVNPRLVYACGSTYGPAGPDAGREGADLAGQAAGGLVSTIGTRGGEPSPVGVTIADHVASLDLLSGILAALLHRERTGRGQKVETSLVGAMVWAQAPEITSYLLTGQLPGPADHGHPLIAGLYGIFPTADGWVAVVGVVGRDRGRFFDLVGRPDLAGRFAAPLYSREDKEALFLELAPVFRSAPTDQWCQRLAAAGLRHAPVRDYAAVTADPAVRANGYVVDGAGLGAAADVVCPPVGFSDSPAAPVGWVPELGQHTEEVLLELGYTWEDIAALRDAGAA